MGGGQEFFRKTHKNIGNYENHNSDRVTALTGPLSARASVLFDHHLIITPNNFEIKITMVIKVDQKDVNLLN